MRPEGERLSCGRIVLQSCGRRVEGVEGVGVMEHSLPAADADQADLRRCGQGRRG